MKRILLVVSSLIASSLVMGIFSSATALMLSGGDTSGIMPVTKKGSDPFFCQPTRLTPGLAEGAVFFYQEPLQYVMAATKAPEPGLSLEGIKFLQKLAYGEWDDLTSRQTKLVLEGIFNLVALQHGLDGVSRYQEGINGDNFSETELGGILKKYFLYIPEGEEYGMEVYREHKSAGGGIDEYNFQFLKERLFLTLDEGMGRINGLDWGIAEIRRKRPLDGDSSKSEEFVLSFMHDNKTVYVLRLIRNAQGDILSEEHLATFIKRQPYVIAPIK